MIYKKIELFDFINYFRSHDRNYYSFDGYKWLYELFDGLGYDYEFDPIAICCEFTEQPIGEFFHDHFAYDGDVWEKYTTFDDDGTELFNMNLIDEFVDYVSQFTECVILNDGDILYRNW